MQKNLCPPNRFFFSKKGMTPAEICHCKIPLLLSLFRNMSSSVEKKKYYKKFVCVKRILYYTVKAMLHEAIFLATCCKRKIHV